MFSFSAHSVIKNILQTLKASNFCFRLLLDHLIHADGVRHQLQTDQNPLVVPVVYLDGPIAPSSVR